MAKLGFLGLGLMGYPMARNLRRAGNDVAVWSNTADKARKLAAEEKCIFCATPKEVAAQSDVDFLYAPVTGSTPGAEGGTLTFMIGGDQAVFEKIRPLLDPMGKKIYFCGGPGMGLQAKLTQNLVLSNILMAFNEGMVLATKGGMDPKLMLEILDNSAAKSGLISYKAPFVLARNFTTNFSVKWMHKDIGLMLESGKDLEVPLPLTGLTRQLFQTAIAAGHGDEDICSTIKVLESLTGTEVVPQK